MYSNVYCVNLFRFHHKRNSILRVFESLKNVLIILAPIDMRLFLTEGVAIWMSHKCVSEELFCTYLHAFSRLVVIRKFVWNKNDAKVGFTYSTQRSIIREMCNTKHNQL